MTRIPTTKPKQCLRVLSLNLWWDDDARKERHEIAAKTADSLQADILLLQEVLPVDGILEAFVDRGYQIAALSPKVGDASRTAVLTKFTFLPQESIRITEKESPREQYAASAIIINKETNIHASSVHLIWGGLTEHARLKQADTLDKEITKRLKATGTTLAIMGGDMNSHPDSANALFLEGVQPYNDRTAQWTDTWNVAGVGPGYTSSPVNQWARVTAEKNGSRNPWQIPERRIDRILVRGWTYGKNLHPIQTYVLDQEYTDHAGDPYPPSDHWGVVADLEE